MPFLDVPGARIYYEQHGPPVTEAAALVFAHGIAGNHLSWWQQVPYFRERWSCVTFSHRGFGRSTSESEPPDAARYADDLERLLDHLAIERAALIAQSMGGWTCLRFAAAHPERVTALVMAGSHGGLTTDAIREAWRAALAALPELPEGVHPAAGARMAEEQPALHFLYREIEALNPPRHDKAFGSIIRAAGRLTPEDVREIHAPVLFLAGEEDRVIPPKVLELASAEIATSKLVRVPSAGHSVYFERASEFNSAVDAWLMSNLSPGAA